ncbi:MAG: cell division protein FtsX [Sphingomonadales bacterium]
MISKKLGILPQDQEKGDLLPWVIAVMTYLLTLFLAGGFVVANSTNNWSSKISKNMTVQIIQADQSQKEQQTIDAIGILKKVPGIIDAKALSEKELVDLLEPWLGLGSNNNSLPIPAMISVITEEGAFINIKALEQQLKNIAPDATIDDHKLWLDQLVLLAKGFEVSVALTVLLITFATIAIVVFSTKGKLATHKNNIEIVHLIGAEDSVISREFNHQFMIFGLKGGVLGLSATTLTLLIAFYITQSFEAPLFPSLQLSIWQIILLLSIPLMTALITKKTADIAVKNYLKQML